MAASPPVLAPDELATSPLLDLDRVGLPVAPLVAVDLSRPVTAAAVEVAARTSRVLVGVATDAIAPEASPLVEELACTLVRSPSGDVRTVHVDDVDRALDAMAGRVAAAPRAAGALVDLLRITSRLPVRDGLAAESFAYSMLLAGPEFARWRAARPVGAPAAEPSPVVRATRDGDLLDVVLSRPHRRNAFDRQVRDELVEALDLALLDPSVHVRLRGDGPSFCSGGDLDEFGTAQDVAGAHLVRLERSAGLRLATLASRTTAVLHGACIGAGIELPSFAGRVVARSDVRIQLPELALGLIPGAGGTVSVPRRVGRWRTAELALSGRVLGAADALAWGLVDAVLGPDDGKGLFVQRNV